MSARRAASVLSLALAFVLAGAACTRSPVTSEDVREDGPVARDDIAEPSPDVPASSTGLPVRHVADPAAAARGEALLTGGTLGRGTLPRLAFSYLWLAWGETAPPTDYPRRMRERYGLYEAPYPNGGLPMGIHAVDANLATFDCMLCHGTVTAGRAVLGVGNSELDLQALHDDLAWLATNAPRFGFPAYPAPFEMHDRTGAAGATDAMGLGMDFATRAFPTTAAVHTRGGFQQAPAWWTLRYRDRAYTDGAGEVGGYRTMMATLLAFGYTLPELAGLEPSFGDIAQYLLTLPAPRWDLTAIDPAARERGRAVYARDCASCHGTYEGPGASYPDRIVPRDEVGTDPVRSASFTSVDADYVNSLTFAGTDHPMTAQGGYLAPPLLGVWATAPYFHNGSVPDLRAVLRSSERPAAWQRVGSDAAGYDTARVGVRFERVDAPPADRSTAPARRVYDTRVPGLANTGHTYGDALTDAELGDLLEYLKSL